MYMCVYMWSVDRLYVMWSGCVHDECEQVPGLYSDCVSGDCTVQVCWVCSWSMYNCVECVSEVCAKCVTGMYGEFVTEVCLCAVCDWSIWTMCDWSLCKNEKCVYELSVCRCVEYMSKARANYVYGLNAGLRRIWGVFAGGECICLQGPIFLIF